MHLTCPFASTFLQPFIICFLFCLAFSIFSQYFQGKYVSRVILTLFCSQSFVLLHRFQGYRWALFGDRASSSGGDEHVFLLFPVSSGEVLHLTTEHWLIGCCTHGWIWRVTANRFLVPNFKLPHFQAASNEVKHHTLPPKNCKTLIVFLFQKPSDPNSRAVPNQASRNKLSQWRINRRRCSSWQTSRSCASTDVCMLNSRRASKLRRASVWRHSRCVWRMQSLQESALRHSTSANCVLPKKMWEVYIISFVILDFCFRKAISQITLQFFALKTIPQAGAADSLGALFSVFRAHLQHAARLRLMPCSREVVITVLPRRLWSNRVQFAWVNGTVALHSLSSMPFGFSFCPSIYTCTCIRNDWNDLEVVLRYRNS